MKRILSRYRGQRIVVYARVDRFGQRLNPKAGSFVPTICLQSVTSAQNEFIATHVWLDYTDDFRKLLLTKGDIVRLSGVVKPYVRSAKGFQCAQDLSNPTKRIDYNLYDIQDARKVSREWILCGETQGRNDNGQNGCDCAGQVHPDQSGLPDEQPVFVTASV